MVAPNEYKIVAVVLHYNSATTLFDVVDAIKVQTLLPCSIVIVDNASDVDLTDRFIGDRSIHFIRLASNEGVGAGHNHGWKVAIDKYGADLIWSLEHDTIPKQDCLEKLMIHYHPQVLAPIGPVEDDGLDYDRNQYYIFHSQGIRRLVNKKKKNVYKGGMSFNGVLIPVHLLNTVGFLNEAFFVGREDFDFFKRIYSKGGHVLRVPQAQVFHNIRRNAKPVNFFGKVFLFPVQSVTREYYSYRNSVYMSKQQGVSRIRLYIRHAVGLLLTLLFRNSKATRLQNRMKAFSNGLAGNLGK